VIPWIAGMGTWSWTPAAPRQEWWRADSAFSAYLRSHGFEHARPERPFVWSGDLDGVPILGRGNDWEAGAEALISYCSYGEPLLERRIIGHSHFGQVALLAAAQGLTIDSLILVGTPVRKAIERLAPAALRNIGTCLHIVDARWDLLGFAGAVFDGRVSLRRTFDVPGIRSVRERGIGHSGLLRTPALFPRWHDRGWLDVLAGRSRVDVSGHLMTDP